MHPHVRIFFALGAAVLMLACTDDEPARNKLAFTTSAPITIVVGDSSASLKVAKTTVDARGRETTDDDYYGCTLTAANPAIASINARHQVKGLTAGETTITAKDDNSNLVSENKVTVTVTPLP